MASFRKLSIVFCLVTIYMIFCSVSGYEDTRFAFPIFDFSRLCSDSFNFTKSRKILCLYCKGFDPSCFSHSTSTTTTSTTSSSTTTTSTTTPSTTSTTITTPKAPETTTVTE